MNDETVFRIVGAGLILIGLSISATHRRRANRSGEEISPEEEGPVILTLRRIFGLAMWLSVLVYLINPRWMAWASLPLPAWLRWLGAVPMAICIPLIYWLFSSLGKNVTRTVAIREEHMLVTHGPYRWVRHPLYSTGVLFFLGLTLLTANWLIGLTTVATFAILIMRTPIEEAKLIERFGDEYREYIKRTGRYLPKLKR